MQRPLEYFRLFSDDAGESHIETAIIALQPERFAPPAPPLDVSAMSRADMLEDTRGKGHLTTIIGDDEVLIVAVRIPDA